MKWLLLLLQTNMRDAGEILTDISLPIFVDSKRWGAFILGIRPEVFIEDYGLRVRQSGKTKKDTEST